MSPMVSLTILPPPMEISRPSFFPAQTLQTVDSVQDETRQTKHDPAIPSGAAALLLANTGRTCPAWLKNTVFRDDTAVAGLAGNHHQAIDKFMASMQQHLALRWMHDRSSAFDHIGSASYAERRRQQLQAIPGAGYLAGQYGLQTVKKKMPTVLRTSKPVLAHGLTLEHQHSAAYQRDVPALQMQEQCLGIYRDRGHTHPEGKLLFVNSHTNASRILAKLKEHEQKSLAGIGALGIAYGLRKEPTNIVPLDSGLVAIEFKNQHDISYARKFLKFLGARPSNYEVDKLAYQVQQATAASSAGETGTKHHQTLPQRSNPEDIDNHQTLQSLLGSETVDVISTLRSLPDGHAMQTIANSAAALLAGLQQALGKRIDTPDFQHDLLIANALDALTSTARALPTLTQDSSLFFPAYNALFEEVKLLLATVHPYGESDFKQAADAMLKTKCGPAFDQLQIAQPETYLLSSGMEAVSTGIEMARKLTGMKRTQPLSSQAHLPDYFETIELKSKGHWYDKDRIRMTPLNPSWPQNAHSDDVINQWNAEKLVDETIAWVNAGKMSQSDPAVLVLDTTVEKLEAEGKSDLSMVVDRLTPYINDGRLKLVLCKSYQKYASLGNAKIMAGGVTVLARDDTKTQLTANALKNAEKDLGWINNDESQLLTHIMTHAQSSELALIDEAAKNAAFVDAFCLQHARQGEHGRIQRADGLPFLIVNDATARRSMRTVSRQMELRSSFGFMGTSLMSPTPKSLRITVGRETREELVEKLYGFGWKLENSQKKLTVAAAQEKIEHIAADAIQTTLRDIDVMSWAPVVLQVVSKRLGHGNRAQMAAVDRCVLLLKQIADLPAATTSLSGQALLRQKARLRQELNTLLNSSVHLTQNLVSDQLRIVASVFAPHLPDQARDAGDVTAMRAAIQRSPELSPASGLDSDELQRARYAANAVASILAMRGIFDTALLSTDESLTLQSLYNVCLESGLSGVSPATRGHIVLDWATLNLKNLHSADPTIQRSAADEVIRHLHLSSYRETGAKILAGIPDEVFARLERPLQQRLTDALFGPLDVDSRVLFIQTLAASKDTRKLVACVTNFHADLKRAEETGSVMLMPDNLSNTAGRPLNQPRPLTQEKRDELLLELQRLQDASVIA